MSHLIKLQSYQAKKVQFDFIVLSPFLNKNRFLTNVTTESLSKKNNLY